jgi:hypothetical protein
MSEPKNPDQAQSPRSSVSGEAAKKPYLKPSFRHEQVFETMALACGKIGASQLQCRVNRKTS